MYKSVIVIVLLIFTVSLVGCTAAEKGACVGALGGAGAGAAIGYFHDQDQTSGDKQEDALTGAGVGALTGAIIGGIIGYFAAE